MDILKELNEQQQLAVKATEGPVMVIAGAGSGKTRVLTYRIAYLLSKGVEPFHILSLTFTNKAAKEMKERIQELFGDQDARNVWMGTFHAIFARILRVDGHHLGFPSTFTIYDTDDSKNLIKHILKELNLDVKVYQPGAVLSRISLAKNNLFSAAEYAENDEFKEYDLAAQKPHIAKIFQIYQARLFKASAMDFDDLLFYTNVLLRDHPDCLLKYQQKFKYILVDEYQDTNFSQYTILKRLAANNENICVVGDDAQSIYGFRGANIENIFNFRRDYPDHQVFKLEQNYRSTQNILNAANCVIKNNRDQIKKTLWTGNDAGPVIHVLKASSDTEEGVLVAHSIFEQKMNHQLPNSGFVILYRTNAQSRSLEDALRKLNIPYRIYGGLSFYRRKEIKDLLAYFRVTVNPHDQESLLRIINYPARGIGQTSLERIQVAADEANLSLWEGLHDLDAIGAGINSGIKAKISDFTTKIKSYQIQVKHKSAYDLAYHITNNSGLLRELREDETPEGVSRAENIEELLNAVSDFTNTPSISEDGEIIPVSQKMRTLDEFLSEVSLLTDMDKEEGEEEQDKVTLMTIHAAKGLEFPHVYVTGLEENLFPSYMSMGTRAELEEERRLFYVAITRAKERLTLAYAETRYRWGNLTMCQPSRFIDEIDAEFVDQPSKVMHTPQNLRKVTPKERKGPTTGSNSLNSGPTESVDMQEIEKIQAGMEVEHARFGKGKVITVEGAGASKKATVDFPGTGEKQLLLRFARLKITGN
ncbi:MAG: UvrD-helicase domain-containing protein [Bacteroidota bacterium]